MKTNRLYIMAKAAAAYFAALITVCFFAVAVPKVAAEGDAGITVASVTVTGANASDILGDGTVSYDAEASVLTLKNAKINGAIVITPEITLVLIGENTVEADDDGITASLLNISGSGSLTVTAGQYAIRCTAYSQNDGIVSLNGGTAAIIAESGQSAIAPTIVLTKAVMLLEGGQVITGTTANGAWASVGEVTASGETPAKATLFREPFMLTVNGSHFMLYDENNSNINAVFVPGERVRFFVRMDEGYKAGADFAVAVNGTPLTPVAGLYTIESVNGDITVSVDGIVAIEHAAKSESGGGLSPATAIAAVVIVLLIITGVRVVEKNRREAALISKQKAEREKNRKK